MEDEKRKQNADWKVIAGILHRALPQIDQVLSEANVSIWARGSKAFDIVLNTMLEVSNREAFLRSEMHGQFLVIIQDWYRDRYGDAVEDDKDGVFVSMLLVHGTPFAMRVPRMFEAPSDIPNAAWVGFPASVQAEEDPLRWIDTKDLSGGLSSEELEVLRETALATANMVRSIDFDTRSLQEENNLSIVELAGSIRADLQSSARNLCERSEAALRSAAWDASQATEKALKVLIRRKGQTPAFVHILPRLAAQAENLGAQPIDRGKLALIPSGRHATDLRYSGALAPSEVADVYGAALSIIRQVVFEGTPSSRYNVREARFEIQRPPWYDFDTSAFREKLQS